MGVVCVFWGVGFCWGLGGLIEFAGVVVGLFLCCFCFCVVLVA